MHLLLAAALKNFIKELMVKQRLTAGECNAAVRSPVGIIAHQDRHKIIDSQESDALLERMSGANLAAIYRLAFVADSPIEDGLTLLIELQRAVRACVTTGCTALIPFTGALGKEKMLLHCPAFGVCTPSALQRAADEKYVCAASGTVMDGIALDVEYHSCFCFWHKLHPSVSELDISHMGKTESSPCMFYCVITFSQTYRS